MINLDEENRHGPTDRNRADKFRIIEQLNKLTNRLIDNNFVDLCESSYQVVTWAQIAEIKTLFDQVGNLPSDELRLIYQTCISQYTYLQMKCSENNFLVCLLGKLAKMSSSSIDHVPILKFVTQISKHKQYVPISHNLNLWIESVSQQLQLTSAPVKKLAQHTGTIAENSPTPLYLLIQMELKQKTLNNYIAQAWLFKGKTIIKQVYPSKSEDKTFTMTTIPKLLDELLDSVENYLIADSQPLTMEFILPKNLLNHNIENYPLPKDDSPIGKDFQIVIRSWERLINKHWLRRCRRYWNSNKEKLHTTSERYVISVLETNNKRR